VSLLVDGNAVYAFTPEGRYTSNFIHGDRIAFAHKVGQGSTLSLDFPENFVTVNCIGAVVHYIGMLPDKGSTAMHVNRVLIFLFAIVAAGSVARTPAAGL